MIIVESLQGKPVTEQGIEIVERKGVGHPDSLCDAIMDAISVALSQVYLAEFGTILHHNIDKSLLAAGKIDRKFGGGRVLKPMELTIGDRATFSFDGKAIPVAEIAVDAAKAWIKGHLRFVNPDKHLKYRVVLAPGSEELTDIFQRGGTVRPANDTSAAIGYYPMSPTERAVLELENYLNGPLFKEKFFETGEDVKVMGLRRQETLEITVAMPLLAEYIPSEKVYFERKRAMSLEMQKFIENMGLFERVTILYNTLDAPGRGLGGVYLSLLGTSAEDADSGQVGRGNRVNGLISLNRPMGTEAAAGKNPVSHVGKIYNVLAHRLAREVYEQVPGVREVYVLLLSRIGEPVDRPVVAAAQILREDGGGVGDIRGKVEEIFEKDFAVMEEFCRQLAAGLFPVC